MTFWHTVEFSRSGCSPSQFFRTSLGATIQTYFARDPESNPGRSPPAPKRTLTRPLSRLRWLGMISCRDRPRTLCESVPQRQETLVPVRDSCEPLRGNRSNLLGSSSSVKLAPAPLPLRSAHADDYRLHGGLHLWMFPAVTGPRASALGPFLVAGQRWKTVRTDPPLVKPASSIPAKSLRDMGFGRPKARIRPGLGARPGPRQVFDDLCGAATNVRAAGREQLPPARGRRP